MWKKITWICYEIKKAAAIVNLGTLSCQSYCLLTNKKLTYEYNILSNNSIIQGVAKLTNSKLGVL